MKPVQLTELLEAGCHFGHRATRWHPKSRPFIFEERDNIHIIDLVKTKAQLEKAANEFNKIGKEGGKILLLGTKRQAKEVILEAAKKSGLPYMVERWIGGMITNWGHVKKNIEKMNQMAKEEKDLTWKTLPKHEQLEKKEALEKLRKIYGGLDELANLPDALYIIDTKREKTAVKEVRCSDFASIAICDTNNNPEEVTIAIPANDDAVGSIKFITDYLIEAYLEGKKNSKREEPKETKKGKK